MGNKTSLLCFVVNEWFRAALRCSFLYGFFHPRTFPYVERLRNDDRGAHLFPRPDSHIHFHEVKNFLLVQSSSSERRQTRDGKNKLPRIVIRLPRATSASLTIQRENCSPALRISFTSGDVDWRNIKRYINKFTPHKSFFTRPARLFCRGIHVSVNESFSMWSFHALIPDDLRSPYVYITRELINSTGVRKLCHNASIRLWKQLSRFEESQSERKARKTSINEQTFYNFTWTTLGSSWNFN